MGTSIYTKQAHIISPHAQDEPLNEPLYQKMMEENTSLLNTKSDRHHSESGPTLIHQLLCCTTH